ncbi:DNA cytosine methyltransferase [Streptomyces daliensis]|uniref:Cytosine-specific methyltransferase n=1 Tax=Streptomyces daliensis TaxID=299421 RepID=A0A8T4IVF7_9ACTN|nr:DNA (cytosine-5-)-methyltransferase [Streptomyces daliensis]
MGASSHDEGQTLTSIEICAGAGGQAIGLHGAGFRHLALVEYDKYAHATLEANFSSAGEWGECEVLREDLIDEFDPRRPMKMLGGSELQPGELSLLSGGVPCPPFSVAGKQLGGDDERDLFPRMLQLVEILDPQAIMIENVRGIMDSKFDEYCESIIDDLRDAGYWFCGWHLLEAHDFGVPQLRPRSVLVAIKDERRKKAGLGMDEFPWPVGVVDPRVTVFQILEKSMRQRRDALSRRFPERKGEFRAAYKKWREKAKDRLDVAPTLVGGSRKHGGADLGPSRAKAAWAALGVNAMGVADETADSKDPVRDFLRPEGPMLTVQQAAAIQSFPEGWKFAGGKTARYRQVGNAFPPPVANAVGRAIASVLQPEKRGELLKGLTIRHLGARRGKREYLQPELGEFSVVPARTEASVTPAPPDLSRDLVSADV